MLIIILHSLFGWIDMTEVGGQLYSLTDKTSFKGECQIVAQHWYWQAIELLHSSWVYTWPPSEIPWRFLACRFTNSFIYSVCYSHSEINGDCRTCVTPNPSCWLLLGRAFTKSFSPSGEKMFQVWDYYRALTGCVCGGHINILAFCDEVFGHK